VTERCDVRLDRIRNAHRYGSIDVALLVRKKVMRAVLLDGPADRTAELLNLERRFDKVRRGNIGIAIGMNEAIVQFAVRIGATEIKHVTSNVVAAGFRNDIDGAGR